MGLKPEDPVEPTGNPFFDGARPSPQAQHVLRGDNTGFLVKKQDGSTVRVYTKTPSPQGSDIVVDDQGHHYKPAPFGDNVIQID